MNWKPNAFSESIFQIYKDEVPLEETCRVVAAKSSLMHL